MRTRSRCGLRPHEAEGKNFPGLDIGLPVGHLRTPIRDVLSGAANSVETTVDAVNRFGKPIQCRVTCGPLRTDGERLGVISLLEAVET
jgi:two-component system CheB/CheR fusion protein